VPRRWLLRTFTRSSDARSSVAGGLLALPSLMCTCCTAPIAAALRRQGAPPSATLAYWSGNPLLNPAVLVFLAVVAPWQWVATRIVVGAVVVFGATALVARLAQPAREPASGERRAAPPARSPADEFRLRAAPVSFARALARLAVTLLPEYLLVVFLLGLFRGWLLPLGVHGMEWWLPATLIAATLGTLIVVPTAGEIPILQGLAAAGVGAAPIGALLITLPAISLVSMAMVVRSLSVKLTWMMALAVAICGVLAGALMSLLG
jgi:uncharacterized membrane protein YraQ (UPF0718 family)